MKKKQKLTLHYVAKKLADIYPEKGDYQYFITILLKAAEKGLLKLESKRRFTR